MISRPLKDTEAIQALFDENPKEIVILGHTHPDGDAVGSGLALAEFLESKGHNVHFILPDPYPEFLSWMPGSEKIIIHVQDDSKTMQLLNQAEILVFADMNSSSRVESLNQIVGDLIQTKTTILFDHHIQPDPKFSYKYWHTDVSSTSELIYEFLCSTGNKHRITRNMAINLYVGIMTDTGSFSYSCNNASTYNVLAHLFELGIDGAYIHQQVYNTFTEERLRLLGFSLSDRLKVYSESGGAYIALSSNDLERYKYVVGDTEGLVNYTMSIRGIYFGALLTDLKKYIKISLRSEGNIDVNFIASHFFNGGGHKNAAGAYFYGSLADACNLIEDIICNHINQ